MPTQKIKKSPKTSQKATSTNHTDIKKLRADLYTLRMKHAMRELKEVHKIKAARKLIARHLTQLHNTSTYA